MKLCRRNPNISGFLLHLIRVNLLNISIRLTWLFLTFLITFGYFKMLNWLKLSGEALGKYAFRLIYYMEILQMWNIFKFFFILLFLKPDCLSFSFFSFTDIFSLVDVVYKPAESASVVRYSVYKTDVNSVKMSFCNWQLVTHLRSLISLLESTMFLLCTVASFNRKSATSVSTFLCFFLFFTSSAWM